MIASFLSHDDRKRRRTARANARKAGLAPQIIRVASTEVSAHIVALTEYLIRPSPAALRELVRIEEPINPVVDYLGREKHAATGPSGLGDWPDDARGERVLQVLTRNLLTTDLPDIQLELALVAGLSPAGADPIEHIVLSWPQGEEPTPEQMEAVLDTLLDVAGLSRHQAYAVVHGDTDNRHLHLAVNRVDPVTGSRVQIGLGIERPLETLHQAIAIVEHRQGWAPQENALYRADEHGCFDRATGIIVRDARMQVVSSAGQHRRIREERARLKEERKISSAARDYERRTGCESLQRRALTTAAPVLREARDWEALHRSLALEGMRYRMLTSGAVIECGDRMIAASTAWGGASADKLTNRLGTYQAPPPDLEVAVFADRVIPALASVAEARRQARARRDAMVRVRASVEGAQREVARGYHDRVATAAGDAPDDLNAIRQEVSQDLEPLKFALRQLQLRRLRALRRRQEGIVEAGDEPGGEETDGADAILMGPHGRHVPPSPDADLVAAGYRVTVEGEHISYRRRAHLCFVDRGDHIDVYRSDTDAVRDALRLAARKWGKVRACGDQAFLERLVRIAVEEGIEITNPELQPLLEAARAERIAAQVRVAEPAPPPSMQGVRASHLPRPDVLRDYAPAFAAWIDLANAAGPRASVDARVGVRAAAIVADPELARQLAELESQQFAFARDLRKAATRSRRQVAQLATLEQYEDIPWWPGDGLPDVPQRPGNAELAAMGVVLVTVPVPGPTAPVIVNKDVRASAVRAPPDLTTQQAATAPTRNDSREDRYLEIAHSRHDRHLAELEGDLAKALRARVGSFDRPPRHIALLLLREAQREAARRRGEHRAPNARDVVERAALTHDAGFSRLMTLACAGDKPTLDRLRSAASGRDDVLGRVTRQPGERLNFDYRSMEGHDPDARPPQEWLDRSLPHIDFTRIRLTRRNGLVGLSDEDLLRATHHNFVALLYPHVQTRIEVEWRLQRERDVALLAKISTGKLVAEISRQGTSASFGITAWEFKGASTAEREHLAVMVKDPDGYRAVLDAVRGSASEAPLDESMPRAALLRATAEGANGQILGLLRQRISAGPETLAQGNGDWASSGDDGMASPSSPAGPGLRRKASTTGQSRRPVQPWGRSR